MRIGLFLGLTLACDLIAQMCYGLTLWALRWPPPNDDQSIYMSEAASAAGMVLALVLMRRLGDHDIPWHSWYDWRGALRQTLAGLGLMAASGLLQAGILYGCGLYRIEGAQRPISLWREPTYMALVAFLEETTFRGYVFRKVEAAGGPWRALLVSSALFGLIHLINGQQTWSDMAQTVLNAFIGGLLLGSAYLLMRSLWLPMALHFMSDYLVSVLFGPGNFGTEWLVTAFIGGGMSIGYWLLQASNIMMTLAFLLLIVRRERQRNAATSTPEEHVPVPG